MTELKSEKTLFIMGIIITATILLAGLPLYYIVTMPDPSKADVAYNIVSSSDLESKKYPTPPEIVPPQRQLEMPKTELLQPTIVQSKDKLEIFYVSVTSENIDETLQNITSAIPTTEGKQYTIHLHVTATDAK